MIPPLFRRCDLPIRSSVSAAALAFFVALVDVAPAATPVPFVIKAIDDASGRPVPLVEFRSTNEVRYFTDSGGTAAVIEPGWEGEEVYFHVQGHGYSVPADGFGYRGVRLVVNSGTTTEVRLKRQLPAERLYRLTGDGRYRDSRLAGLPVPPGAGGGAAPGGVFGLDSTQATVHRGKVFWFWGDTNRAGYPLGNFYTSGATSPLPDGGGFDVEAGIPFDFFTVPDGSFVKPLYRRRGDEPGPIWTDGVFSLDDPDGTPKIVAHYTRVKDLGTTLEHGIAVFDDEDESFRREHVLPLAEEWRFPQGHAFKVDVDGVEYVYFAQPFPSVRVPAKWGSVSDPAQYEKVGGLPETLADADGGGPVTVHRASVHWNAFRKKFVLIGVQQGGEASYLGEVWYAEAPRPEGPWSKAVRVATHHRYTFYNPVHHPFLDREGGRIIYFEGTYSHSFSRTPRAGATPRYDYNQVLYRLDLGDPRLAASKLSHE